MSYTDRWIRFSEESTWGEWTTIGSTFPNYLNEWSATTTENISEEELIGGSRDWRKVVWLEEGVVARWVQELVSAKFFEYILGSKDGDTSPVEYTIAATLPSLSIYRGLYPDENGNTFSVGYMGMKVDTAELTIEEGSDVRLEVNFAGKGGTILTSHLSKPSLDASVVPFAFYHSSIDLIHPNGTENLNKLSRLQISVNNNLEAIVSAGAQSYQPTELREGATEVTGRIVVRGHFPLLSSIVLNRVTCTLNVYLIKTQHTIQITVNNITFNEYPDELTGLDIVESELSFSARPTSTTSAIVVTETFSGEFDSLPF